MQEHQRLKALIHEVSQLTLALIKGHVRAPPAPAGATLNIGPILAQTVGHFFPELNAWIDQIDDPRFPPLVVYHKRFLVWWGLSLFLCKLSSRRQLDYQLNTDGPEVLANLNRLAGTAQDSRPVNQTLEYFLENIGSAPIAGLRQRMVQRLIRMKALDAARLQGRFVVLIDGSGYLVFRSRHCDHCLTQRHGETTLYMHQVLEAKLLGPAGTVVSIATEFIDNRDAASAPAGAGAGTDQAGLRVEGAAAARGRRCGRSSRSCGSASAVTACMPAGKGSRSPKTINAITFTRFSPGGCRPSGRTSRGCCGCAPTSGWSGRRRRGSGRSIAGSTACTTRTATAVTGPSTLMECTETDQDGKQTEWSWVTSLEVNHETVVEVATNGGRARWRAENEGFNTQKNSGLNLEHAYSHTMLAGVLFPVADRPPAVATGGEGEPAAAVGPRAGQANGGGAVRLVEEHGATVVGEPAVLALARRGLRPNRSRCDPDPPGQQLAQLSQERIKR